MEQTIKLLPYSETHYEDLMNYELDEVQIKFTAMPRENLVTRNVLADPEKHAVSIMLQDKAIGFLFLIPDRIRCNSATTHKLCCSVRYPLTLRTRVRATGTRP